MFSSTVCFCGIPFSIIGKFSVHFTCLSHFDRLWGYKSAYTFHFLGEIAVHVRDTDLKKKTREFQQSMENALLEDERVP